MNKPHFKIGRRPRIAALLIASALLSAASSRSMAQPMRPPGVPAQRMDFRDLGYPFYTKVPADAAFITSLATAPDGLVYGATSGIQSYLFAFSAKTNRVKPLGSIAQAEGVHHSLVIDGDGIVYVGTGRDLQKTFVIKPDLSAGVNHISTDIWTQVQEYYAGYSGGHIYRYDPAEAPRSSRPGQPARVKDLGVPVSGDGIYCMAIDPRRQILYGVTYPRAHFFVHDLRQGKSTDKGVIYKKVLFGGPDDRTLRSLPRALAVATDGSVYTSADDGHIVRYDPSTQELETLGATIPGEAMQVVEAWVPDGDVFYGGTSEGFLFRFSPATGEIDNLGKPMVAERIRGLALGKDGKVYGLAGDRSAPNLLFSYDPKRSRLESMGGVAVDRSPHYLWYGQQFDAMTTGTDGTIFMGESDRGGRLFFYIP